MSKIRPTTPRTFNTRLHRPGNEPHVMDWDIEIKLGCIIHRLYGPTPHKRVITIGKTPWSKGCPHIFRGLHLPGGGL